MFGIISVLSMVSVVQALDSLIAPPSYLIAYVTGDTSVKLSWEVKVPSNNTVYQLKWKIKSNESSMTVDGTTGTATVYNLKVYTQYLFRVRRGYIGGKWGQFTKYTHILTPEGVPTAPPANVTAYNASSVSIMVFWNQVPKPNRHGYVLGYKVCYERADQNDSVMYCTTVFALGIELGGLRTYTPYWITVLGFTNKGEGPTSKPLKVWTDEFVPSAAPQVLSLTANTTAVHVRWSPIPQEHVNGILRGYYVIYWRRPRVSPYNRMIQVNQLTLSAYIKGLERNTTYGVRVTGLTRIRGWLRNGALSTVYNVTTKHGSSAPDNVKIFSSCSSCLTVVWDPVSATGTDKTILGYRVMYRQDSERGNSKDLDFSATTAKLLNLKKYSRYTVTVSAITDEGPGEASSPITVRTKEDVPSRAPDSIKATSTGSRSIKVDWSAVPPKYVHGILRGYHVYYKSEKMKSRRSANQAGAIKALSVNMSSLGVEITGLKPFTSYAVWVSAFTDAGSGPSSTTVTVMTHEDVPSRAPQLLKVLAKSSTTVFVQWQPIPHRDVQGILQGYQVHYRQENSRYPVIKKVVTVNESVDQVTLDNMKPLTRYRVWITPFTAKGPGPESSHAFALTPQDAPQSPTQVHVQILSPQSVRITWQSHSRFAGHVTRYMVKWQHLGNPSQPKVDGHKIINAGKPYHRETQVGGLKPFSLYAFVVREEVGQENWGAFSEPVDVILPEDVPTPPRSVSVRSKEGTRLVLQWRRPQSMNGVLRKYVVHFKNSQGKTRSFTSDLNIDKEFVMYEVTLPDFETEYKIQVQAFNSLPGSMSDVVTVQHSPSVKAEEARQSSIFKSKLIWLIAGLAVVFLLLVFVIVFVLFRRESRRTQFKHHAHKLSIISTSAKPRRPIPMKELATYCARNHENNHALFVDEFRCLDRLTWKSTWEASLAPFNKAKNRYCNVMAYDHSRVVLTAKKEVPGSDYINANYVDGYSTPAKYIATQGPLKETVNDFWRMVWEKNVRTIVMIDTQGKDHCGNEDSGCEQYWHDMEPMEYGHVAVSLLSTTVMTDWKIREFIAWSIDPECMDKREVLHYQFTSWPDHYVPHDTAPFLMFHHKLRLALGADVGPIVVHCSAGVGRTGTFIAIDSLVEQMETEQVVDVYGFVAQMRKQRNFMVKTKEQYWFIYEVLRDLSICGVTAIPSLEMGSGLMFFNGDEQEVVNRRTAEFENLQVFPINSPLFSDALVRENVVKNRCPEVLPFNHNRVRLKKISDAPGTDYINASFIDGYSEGRLYVATQGPMAGTVEDFWRMIWEQRSTVVVMLTELQDNGMEQSVQYWPEEGCAKFGKLRVTKIDEEVLDDHTQRVFKVRSHGSEESLVLYHFQYQSWPENGLTAFQSLLYLHQQVHKIRSGEHRSGPIIVHCSNGDGRTGVFLTLSLSIDRLEAEDSVDVFQTARWLRSQRPGLVGNSEQYNFCYETIKSYLAWRIRGNSNDYV